MGFLLESPVQIVRFSTLHLSTRRGALQILVNGSRPFDNAESVDGIAWSIYSSNPIIPAPNRGRNVIKDGSTYIFYVVKHPSMTVHRFTSTDGIAWTDAGLVLPQGTGGDWDAGGPLPMSSRGKKTLPIGT